MCLVFTTCKYSVEYFPASARKQAPIYHEHYFNRFEFRQKKNADEKSPFQPKVQVLLLLMDLLFFVGRKIKYYDTFEISSGSSFFTSSEWDLSKERERKREGKATRKAADSRATCERDG
jgi:hypothetical protein